MSSSEENNKATSSSPNKSQGNYRGGYHNRNTPYPRRPHPGPRSGRDSSGGGGGGRDNRHFPFKSEKAECNLVDSEPHPRDRNLSVEGMMPSKPHEKKFTGRCRIFVGNVPSDMSDDEFKKLFEPYGETTEVFLNAGRGFGFVKMETRHKAEEARAALDGQLTKAGRNLRVRLAGHNAALRVKYLPQHVSNEMLEKTFSMFGEVERAIVVVDDKGKPTGEGIVEFARRNAAMSAFKRISEGIFLMTSLMRPIAVEMLEQNDESDGLPEVFFAKTPELMKDRDKPPRFAQPGSFEAEMGQKWKKLYQLYKDQEDLLKRNFADEVAKLEGDQENALMEQHTLMLRQDIQRRQEELRMLEEQNDIKRKFEIRRQEEDRRRGHVMPDADMRRRPDVLRRHMEVAKNSPNESFFPMERTQERPNLAPPLQPPPVPPGVDRIRMGALNLLGSLGSPQAMGGLNNGGNVRMGILPRPPMSGGNHPPLLMDPSTPMRPPQGIRFDAPQGVGPTGGNLFGLRPPTNMGPGLASAPSDVHGPSDHAEAKRARRI